MAAPVKETDQLVDAGACGWCQHVQWSHKRGKNGCKELDCPCGKYEPPKGRPAPVSTFEVDPASEIAGELVEGPAVLGPAVCVGGFEPAQPGDVDLPVGPEPTPDEDIAAGRTVEFGSVEEMDAALDAVAVVADPVAQAEHVVQVAAIDAQLAEPEPTDDQVADEIDRAEDAAQIERLTAELEQVRADKLRLAGQLAPRLADLDRALGELATLRNVNVELGRACSEIDRVKRHNRELCEALTRAEGDRDTAQTALRKTAEAYVHTSIAAATNVLFRYDADQCTTEGCGSRYTVPVEHEHPLTPVTVLVVRREVPGA